VKLYIHTPGRLAVPGVKQGVNEYIRRISDWSLEHTRGLPDQKREGERWIGLDPSGKMTTTEGIHRWMNKQANRSCSVIRFLIGGKEGLNSKMMDRADWNWSLGPLVINQSLAALVVAEQCYRAFALRTGHPYHE